MGNVSGGKRMNLAEHNEDEKFLFVESGLNALEKINWYGHTTFNCPVCGAAADAKRVRIVNSSRNKATWLYCNQCGMYVHG